MSRPFFCVAWLHISIRFVYNCVVPLKPLLENHMLAPIKKIDFTNTAQWKYVAFCVFGPLEDSDGELNEAYYIAEMISEMIAEENSRNLTDDEYRDIEWFGYHEAHEFADKGARFDVRGTCDHCGAHFRYGAAYRNVVTGEHAVVGHVCATNTLNLTASEYAMKKAKTRMKAIRQRAKADAREARLAPNRHAFLNYGDGFDAYDRTDKRNAFAAELAMDMRHKFRKYDSLSVKQWAFLKDVVTKDRNRIAERETADAEFNPIPDELFEGRHTFTGRIASTKWVETLYGDMHKMLMIDDRGFKLWGTVPRALDGNKGDRVQFDATIDKSDENTFAFFARPTKAKTIEHAEQD